MADNTLEGKSAEEINSLAALGVALYNNPKTRGEYLKLIKQADPNVSLPELDAQEAVNAAVSASNKKVEDLTAKIAERDARDRLDRIERGLIEQGLVTKEELPDLHKYAKENGFTLGQLDKAARLRAADRQMAAPTPETFAQSMTHSLPEKAKDIARNPKKWAFEEASRALNEINARKQTGGQRF